MKRSVRSGIAIAGLAGGFWLLGQAVANADEAASTGTQTVGTSAGATGGGSADSSTKQTVDASNTNTNTATTGDINASGGHSTVDVTAGNGNTAAASSDSGAVKASQTVTNVIWISSEANGGTVSGSNNAAAGNGVSNTATAKGTQSSTTTGGNDKKGGEAESKTRQHVDASNYNDNYASTGDINAKGGSSYVDVAAGNENNVEATNGHDMLPVWTLSQDKKCHDNYGDDHKKRHDGNVDASQTVDTKVTISSEANGGSVSDSNNAAAGNGVSNTATANGTQDSKTTGGNGGKGKEDKGGDAESSTHQDVNASNENNNTASTGDINVSGGHSTVDVVAGNGNTLYCTSKTGNVTCSQNISTIINIISQANGGSVSCSNNAAAGNAGSAVCPVTNNNTSNNSNSGNNSKTAPAAAPAAQMAVAPAATKSSVSASAQSTGTLAFTGAETSLPLTLGLLALGVGGALTLAGRRRETTTV